MIKSKTMKKIYYIAVLILSALFLGACSDKDAGSGVFAEAEDVPVSTYLAQDEEGRFTVWVELLKKADLYNALNISGSNTCFVPTDEAMKKYFTSNNISGVSAISKDDAKILIKYHTISGKSITHSSFVDGVIPDTVASGDFLSISIREGGLSQIYVNDEARIEKLSIKVSNGVIHILETALTPITETVYGKLSKDKFSIFRSLVDATGYNERLDVISYVENYVERKYKYTLFAEPNEVFGEYQTVEQVAAMLGAEDDNYKDESNALNQFVAYHILTQQYGYSELANANTNVSPLAPKRLMSLKDVDGTFFINYNSENGDGVTLREYNINCKNGIIHELNSILEIYTPKPTTVTWELTDYSDLASLFSSVYRVTSASSTSTKYVTDDDGVSCFTWRTVPETKVNNSVAYRIAPSDNVRKSAVNRDYLLLSLGLSGWIEMKTPTILAGKYTVKIGYYSPQGSSKSGLLSFIFDGNILSSLMLNGDSNSSAAYKKDITLGTLEFTDMDTHTLRILAGDSNTTEIDYIKFVPVN